MLNNRIIKKSFLAIAFILVLIACNYKVVDKKQTLATLTEVIEKAYFEGQKDYMNGDIRIKYVEKDECYVWIKSPWNDLTAPIYDPSKTHGGR